jgi:uncharacterized phage infection (PIP) family protein YhgE
MLKKRTIILGVIAVTAVGAGLTYSWRHWQEKSVLNDSRIAQVASDKEVTSGPAMKLH